MNKLINYILIISFFFATTSILAQHTNYPTKKLNGSEFYIYTVQQGEGLYGISRRFEVTQADINTLNPEIQTGLKPGQQILIPLNSKNANLKSTGSVAAKKVESDSPATFITHKVERRQTLFAISRKYGVSQDEIKKMNPEIESGLKMDMLLKIPVQKIVEQKENEKKVQDKLKQQDEEPVKTSETSFITHKVKTKETLYSISRMYGITVDELKNFNPISDNNLKGGAELRIPVKLESNIKDSVKYIDNVDNKINSSFTKTIIDQRVKTNISSIRIAFLLPFMSETSKVDVATERFLDFYAGALIAINQAKANGVNLEILTFDVEKSDEKIVEVFQENYQLKNVDFIIGPAYTNQVQYVSDFARKNKIHTLIPFSSKVNDVKQNPYIFQFNPGMEIEVNFVSELLTSKFRDYNIVFADLQGVNFLDEGNEFAVALRNALDIKRRSYKRVDFHTDTPLPLSDVIEKNKKNIVFFNTDKYSSASPYLPLINEFNNNSNITIYQQYSWLPQNINGFATLAVSAFKTNESSGKLTAYEHSFRESFNWEPKSENPRFDLLGYDLASYFIATIYYQGNSFMKKERNELPASQGIQSELKFTRSDENSGYINQKLYLNEKK